MKILDSFFTKREGNNKPYSHDDKTAYCPHCKKSTLQRPYEHVVLVTNQGNKWYCFGHSGLIN